MLRADIDIELLVEGPFLTQSTAPGEYGLDAVVARDADGVPCIHGTHVVGKLRQAWEELRDALGDGVEEDTIPSADGIEDLLGEQLKDGEFEPKFKRLYFSDFLLTTPNPGKGVRYRIGIDQDRGSVRKAAQFALDCPFGAGEPVWFKGRLSFLAATEEETRKIRDQVECGLQWVPQLGADRSTGFGKLLQVIVSNVLPKPLTIVERDWRDTTGFDLAVKPDGPFCIARRQVDGNLFESVEEIPGNVILGCLSRSLSMLLGRKQATLDKGSEGEPFGVLREHFNAIRITHAFPGGECLQRPVRAPLSLVKADGLYDVALQDSPCLINGRAPEFGVDWKEHDDVRQIFGWPHLRTEMRVRTAIDPAKLRSKKAELFAYEMIVPDGRCWNARVSLRVARPEVDPKDGIPEEDRKKVLDQLAALLELGLFGLGKTKTTARAVVHPSGTISDVWETGAIDSAIETHGLLLITLQTPALLCSSTELNENSGAAELRKAYTESWKGLCPELKLLRYFARQTLSGGEYQHRQFRSGQPYRPWLLTDAGSIFVFQVDGWPKVEEKAQDWLEYGLPLPEPVRRCYGMTGAAVPDWRLCPFIPQNGYGEIAVNLAVHGDLRPPHECTDEIDRIEDLQSG